MKPAGAPPADESKVASGIPPKISSRDLFDRGKEVIIEHGVEQYRLRITANDKLILIK